MGATGGKLEPREVLTRSGLAGAPTVDVACWWPAFRKRCPRFACGVDGFLAVFGALLPEGTASPAQLDEVFTSLDPSERGLVDGFELFAALTLLSRGTLAAKAELLFSIFDIGGRGTLDAPSLGLLLERCSSGLVKCCSCHGLHVPQRLPRSMVDRAFRGRPPSQPMTRADFDSWWQHNALVRRALWKCVDEDEEDEALPGETEWREEHYTELDEPPPAVSALANVGPGQGTEADSEKRGDVKQTGTAVEEGSSKPIVDQGDAMPEDSSTFLEAEEDGPNDS